MVVVLYLQTWDQRINNAMCTSQLKLIGMGEGDMAIQPIGTNHKSTNLVILSYQIDLHTTYSVE